MQTILGAGGPAANYVAGSLPAYTDKVRLVSRNPKAIVGNEELYKADLLQKEQVMKAVEGSEIVYLTAGLVYNKHIWQQQWPVVMQNVIEACIAHGSKFVFFDNVYMYGKVNGVMTEHTAYNPCSAKGEVRASIARMLEKEVEAGRLKALIARSADFYGPATPNSYPGMMIFNNLKKGKSAQLMVGSQFIHSYTFTPDAGKAVAMLGNTDTAFNQTWHLPTSKNALTGKEFVEMAANELRVKPKINVLPRFMIKIAGWFDPMIAEVYEMLYQYDSDYFFDSSKFEKAFNFTPTTYQEGIRLSLKSE
jgi:nucleoside-diphosphate-sugar epimerase